MPNKEENGAKKDIARPKIKFVKYKTGKEGIFQTKIIFSMKDENSGSNYPPCNYIHI
jgi:hypothetical protein